MDWKLATSLTLPILAALGQWFWLRIKMGDVLKAQDKAEERMGVLERDVNGVKMQAAVESQKMNGISEDVKQISRKLDKMFDLLVNGKIKSRGDTDE